MYRINYKYHVSDSKRPYWLLWLVAVYNPKGIKCQTKEEAESALYSLEQIFKDMEYKGLNSVNKLGNTHQFKWEGDKLTIYTLSNRPIVTFSVEEISE